jgi:hypothetical protein
LHDLSGLDEVELHLGFVRIASNPDIILGGAITALMARIGDPARLDQQQPDLVLGIGLVFDSFRHDEHFARRYVDRAIAEIDPENTFQHNEGLIRMLVIVPDEVALKLDDLELVVVHFGYDLRLPQLVEQFELSAEVDRFIAHLALRQPSYKVYERLASRAKMAFSENAAFSGEAK